MVLVTDEDGQLMSKMEISRLDGHQCGYGTPDRKNIWIKILSVVACFSWQPF